MWPAGLALLAVAFGAAGCGSGSDSTQPPPLYEPALGFDDASGQLVMFGGAASRTYSDTWLWEGAEWHQLHPPHAPSPRLGASMAYDPISRRLMLYGGAYYTPGDAAAPLRSAAGMSTSRVDSDTWAWDGHDWTQLAASQSNPGELPSSRLGFDAGDGLMIRQDLCPHRHRATRCRMP